MKTGMMEILTQDILVSCILMGLIGVVGIIGNLLMLRALVKYKNLRTDFYTVFGCLSIADTVFLLFSVPAHIIDMLQASHVSSDLWCKSSVYVTNACGFITAYLIVVLSGLRSIILTNRNTISQPQSHHMVIVSLALYALAFMSSIPIIFMYSFTEDYCHISDESKIIQEAWLINSFSAFVPILLSAIIYFITYIIGKRYFSDSYSRSEIQKSHLVNSILVAFIICQLPYRIAVIYDSYLIFQPEELEKMYTIKNYLMCLVMADKAIKPVLYSKFALDLSDAFDEVINCTYCSQPYNGVPVRTARFVDSATAERTQSTSSSNSATSQTVLLNKNNEYFEADIC